MTQPSIVLLVIDSLRADHLSCYGYASRTSPCIDRLAEESARFSTAISQADYTHPSHGALFTGLYPFEWGGNFPRLPEHMPTIAEILSRRGWRTVCVSANPFLWEQHGLNRGFDRTVRVSPLGLKGVSPISAFGRLWSVLHGDKGAGRVIDGVLEALDTGPAFVFANLMDVHQPYSARGRHVRLFWPGFLGPLRRYAMLWRTRYSYEFIAKATEQDLRQLRALYDAAVHQVDSFIGAFAEELRRRGHLDSTILVLTSDHGHFLGELGRIVNIGIGEGGVHVPLLIRWPEVWREGVEVDSPVELRDVPFSLCELLGVEGLAWSCRPRANLFGDPEPHRDRFAFAMRQKMDERARQVSRRLNPSFDWHRHDQTYWLLRTREWEFIRSTGRMNGLFRPDDETTDLSAEHPDLVRWFEEEFRALVPTTTSEGTGVAGDAGDRQVEEHLRALGYL
ncbi:MAG: sulfatase [Armatimonadetes bacterium]|nr:sulfatase [Armatimonadota bacterium]